MPISDLGTISQLGRILQVNNAMVAEVFLRSKTTGYINIIFAMTEQNQTISEFLRLNVSFETAILNSSGQHMCLCDIQKGMVVDSLFSPIMERRIPPQSNAFLIVARNYNQPPLDSITGYITNVDIEGYYFYLADPYNTDNQINFLVSNTTSIRDRNGNSVPFRSLRPGLLVNVTHSNIETGDIPLQADAFHIQTI